MNSQSCLFQVLFCLLAARHSLVVAQGPNPACQVCGCSTCPTTFEMANPDATFNVPEEHKAEFFNLATVPCGTIQTLGLNGQIPANLCTDEVRLFEDFRTTCGCPPVPGAAKPTPTPVAPKVVPAPVAVVADTPVIAAAITSAPHVAPVSSAPVVAPVTSAPVSAPVTSAPVIAPITSAPVIAPELVTAPSDVPTITPSLAITKCEICSCATCANGSVQNKDGVYTIPDELSERFPGFTSVGCVDLENFASNGVFKEIDFICSDEFRMRDDFRNACGCNERLQVEAPIPVLCPPDEPQASLGLFTCDICGDGLKMSNRNGIYQLNTLGGLTEAHVMICGNLEDVAFFGDTNQEFTMAICDDSFRMNTDFRTTCGCPSMDNGKDEEKENEDEKDVVKKPKQKESNDVVSDPPKSDNGDDKQVPGDNNNNHKTKPEKTQKLNNDDDEDPPVGKTDDNNDDDNGKEGGEDAKVNNNKQAKKSGGRMKLIRRKQY